MAKFILDGSFTALFPEAAIAVVVARGIDNTVSGNAPRRAEIQTLLEEAARESVRFLGADVFSENPVVAVWRSAYQKFKTKKGARCSIEALLKRVEKGSGLPAINPLVDLYNAVSLRFGLPCGGEDMDAFSGDLILGLAKGGEDFLALGDEAPDPALPGELVYRDDLGVVCRCWNWRDGQRTMLTEKTKDAFLVIESVDPGRAGDLAHAADTLAELIRDFLGGDARIHILGGENPKALDLS
jgi:DNA/RNA-binding domain of Phe-tRNA-synthetase-like protein